ncbi:helix-turn-helix transcriptional regulator [Bacillus mycoides]|uniref:helix-turn-helix transcriptional regulator n=1 Tax=Bacillus mycoides TaxID=1405 RepID=UPI003CFFCC4B
MTLQYSRGENGYILYKQSPYWFSYGELLAICKILVNSRAFSKKQTMVILDKLMKLTDKEKRNLIREQLKNELFHYHSSELKDSQLELISKISWAIYKKKGIAIIYKSHLGRSKKSEIHLYPIGIVFFSQYFYLFSISKGNVMEYITIHRLDKIISLKIKDNQKISFSHNRIEVGELTKGFPTEPLGDYINVRLRFLDVNFQDVMEEFPGAQIMSKSKVDTIIEVKGFANGIRKWVLKSLPLVEVLEPKSLREEIMIILEKSLKVYS